MSEIVALNIPNVTVTEVVETLAQLYTRAIEKGTPFKRLLTPFLWGAPGIGKSNGVLQLAERLEKETGKTVTVTDVRLLLFSPVDLRGVPMADVKREFTDWLKPRIFDMRTEDDTVNLLFLDELSAAPPTLQAGAYQICLDRRVGEHILPQNCIVIAAGNRMTDNSVSYKMPKALCNRLMHFNVQSDCEAWRRWAIGHGVHPSVIAFLGMDNSRLCLDPEASDFAYATPRTWEAVSTLLHTMSDDPEEIHTLISACIGNTMALEFEAYCKGILKLPDVKGILNGTCTEIPRGYDVIFALIAALLAALPKAEDYELENACRYVQSPRFPKDFTAMFMQDMMQLPGMRTRLIKCRSFQLWLNKV